MLVLERKGVDFSELQNLIKGRVEMDQSIAPYTTYHIGGKAAVFVEPQSVEDLETLLRCLTLAQVPYLLLGGGSNVLFADEGYRGAVIRLGRNFQGVRIEGDRVRAKAGTRLVSVLEKTREAGLGGVEFFAGIPGTLGGAVVGNAGAKKAWIGPLVQELTVVTPRGEVRRLEKGDYAYGYRTSSLKGSGNVLVEAVLKLKKEPPEEIEKKVKEYFRNRRGKQPRTEKNAGSVFKNPDKNSAGKLIETAGLKSFQVGGARVSEIHANFINNEGNATAHDVVAVMREIQRRVFEKFLVRLEPEIVPLGDWDRDEIRDVFGNPQKTS